MCSMRPLLAAVLVLLLAPPAAAKKPKASDPAPWPTGTRPALDCSAAIPIGCDDSAQNSNVGAPSNVDYYSCISWLEPGGEVVFELVLPGPGHTTVSASLSGMPCDLDVFLLGSCDEGDCIGYGNTSFTVPTLPSGTYYIVVDGYEGDACEFTLGVTCTDVPSPCCPLLEECVAFDFNASDGGFWTIPCGGTSVWEWGAAPSPGVACDGVGVTNVLGTVLQGDYPNLAGEAAVLGPVSITADCTCLELCHMYTTEEPYDGGNVKVSADDGATWVLVIPAAQYDFATDDENACVPSEAVFTDELGSPWTSDCFDLSQYVDDELLIGFFFGSDESVTSPGWYIKWAKLGSDTTPVEHSSWGAIKGLYR